MKKVQIEKLVSYEMVIELGLEYPGHEYVRMENAYLFLCQSVDHHDNVYFQAHDHLELILAILEILVVVIDSIFGDAMSGDDDEIVLLILPETSLGLLMQVVIME